MKRTIATLWMWTLGLVIVLAIAGPVWAAVPVQQLNQMEQQIFARTYESETLANRLTRLETTVFGAGQADRSEDDRFMALSQFFNFTQTSQATSQQPPQSSVGAYTPPPASDVTVAPAETSYPAVTTMEQRVLQQTYEQEPIYHRLARLEQRVLGKPQQGNLQERTDQLKMIVLGDTGSGQGVQVPAIGMPDVLGGEPVSGASVGASADLLQALPPVERKVLGRSYPEEPVEQRLERLEMKVFNSPAPEMSPEDRMFRIAGVINAQKSAGREQTFGGGPYYGGGRAPSAMGSFGSLLLMVLMSLL